MSYIFYPLFFSILYICYLGVTGKYIDKEED
ncbi:hypothetical protein ERAQ111492_06770 [Erysipelothrix aquatica]